MNCKKKRFEKRVIKESQIKNILKKCFPLFLSENSLITENLVLAIIKIESHGDQYAQRYEPKFRWIDIKRERPALCGDELELFSQKCSFGLGQIMLSTARDLGFTGWPGELFNPELNCRLIVELLVKLEKRGDVKCIEDIIAAYNAGSPRKNPSTGEYVNGLYIGKVKQELKERENQTVFQTIIPRREICRKDKNK